jgi:hypothetical protein
VVRNYSLSTSGEPNSHNAKLIDWEIASMDLRAERLLMAPAFAIPCTTYRNYFTEARQGQVPAVSTISIR